MATPVVSGAALLLRQYLAEGWWPSGAPREEDRVASAPAALLKALLVHSALPVGGTVLTKRFDLSVEADAVAVPSFRRLSFAEAHFLSRRLASTSPRPCFVILPRQVTSETASSPGAELQATIASILSTARHGVQPNILIHADCLPTTAPVPSGCHCFRSGRG